LCYVKGIKFKGIRMVNGHCNNHGNCGCAGLTDDGDEFYDFSTPEKVEEKPAMREVIHPKDNAELEKILAAIPEVGGSKTTDNPTAHGDWALKGRVSDF
jgi:hypothetical protein